MLQKRQETQLIFSEQTFFDVTKNVMTFFRKFIYNHQNNVVTIETTKNSTTKFKMMFFQFLLKMNKEFNFSLYLSREVLTRRHE